MLLEADADVDGRLMVTRYHSASETDIARARTAAELCDAHYLVLVHNYKEAQKTYRITAEGRSQLKPCYMKFLTNVSSNFPTVITSVVIALLSAWLLSKLGPDGSVIEAIRSDALELGD